VLFAVWGLTQYWSQRFFDAHAPSSRQCNSSGLSSFILCNRLILTNLKLILSNNWTQLSAMYILLELGMKHHTVYPKTNIYIEIDIYVLLQIYCSFVIGMYASCISLCWIKYSSACWRGHRKTAIYDLQILQICTYIQYIGSILYISCSGQYGEQEGEGAHVGRHEEQGETGAFRRSRYR
jgi:hypothetical protein